MPASPPSVHAPGVPAAFLALVAAQALHSLEEYAGRLWEGFAPARWISGLIAADLELGFVLFNAAWVAFGLWGWLWPIRRGWPSAAAFAWLWVVVEVVNGVGHPVWALSAGAYVPGLLTAPLLLVLALVLAWRLAGASRVTSAAALLPFALVVASCATGRAPVRDGYLPGAGDARIHYRVLGAAPDTIVVVHGGPGAGMNAVLPELRPLAERRTAIFYDQRGGGLSDLPADTTLLDARYHVTDLEAVRRFFGLERMTLVAHSFGSILVARYAMEHPDRVERLVFFGAVGPSRAAAAAVARAASAPPDPVLQERLRAVMGALMSGSTSDPLADCREYEAIGREMALTRGESGEWKGTNCAMPPEAIRYYFRYTAQLSPRSFGDWDFTESLGEVEAPLLVIHGDIDPEAVAAQRAWAEAVPNGRLLLVPNAGKSVSADRPDWFFPAIETFLDGEWPAGAEAQ